MRHPDVSEEVKEESLCALIQSLKENNSLEILDLSECQWILTPRVIPTLMDVLLKNFTLREINFGNSPISYSVKKQLRKNVQYRESCLRKLPVAKAWASRVFLCGSPYAGMCHGSDTTVRVFCLLHGISRAGGFRFFLSKSILFQPAKSSIAPQATPLDQIHLFTMTRFSE